MRLLGKTVWNSVGCGEADNNLDAYRRQSFPLLSYPRESNKPSKAQKELLRVHLTHLLLFWG